MLEVTDYLKLDW